MCLKYYEGSLKTQSMMQSTICLPRLSNSLLLKCNVHKIIKRSFHGLQCGLKGRRKEVDKYFGNVELKAKKTMEQPTLNQGNIKGTKALTLIEVLPQIKGNELNMCFYPFFFFLPFCLSYFFFSFLFCFFVFFFKLK